MEISMSASIARRTMFFGLILVVLLALPACTFPPSGISNLSSDDDQNGTEPTATASATPVPEVDPVDDERQEEDPEPTATATATHTPTPTEPITEVGPDDFPADHNPLTGEKLNSPQNLERRPMLIKVSNFPVGGRPHSGLSFADWVFEYFIGEGMTRFTAVFYGQDSPRVGPIRSGRLIDGELTRMFGGVLAMKGADPYVTSRLASLLPGRMFNAKPSACPALCPETVSHTYGTFADTAAFEEYMREQGLENVRQQLAGLFFDSAPPTGGLAGQSLHLFYSYLNQVGWDYDPSTGVYLRSQDNADAVLAPILDGVTEQQLAFENVLILYTWHEFRSPTLIEIDLWYAEGRRALLFRDGEVHELTFSTTSPDQPLQLFDQNGDLFPLKPGSTWVEVVGMGSTTEQLDDGAWKVRFYP
jgi:hypothetical protein